jgi:hypothetical protein
VAGRTGSRRGPGPSMDGPSAGRAVPSSRAVTRLRWFRPSPRRWPDPGSPGLGQRERRRSVVGMASSGPTRTYVANKPGRSSRLFGSGLVPPGWKRWTYRPSMSGLDRLSFVSGRPDRLRSILLPFPFPSDRRFRPRGQPAVLPALDHSSARDRRAQSAGAGRRAPAVAVPNQASPQRDPPAPT